MRRNKSYNTECECLQNFIASHKEELKQIDDQKVITAIEDIADVLHDNLSKRELEDIKKQC
ncbi:MAG: hypothetical protein Q4D11_00745 [Rhodospirillales bacterium]|nr:hypothetical protein [Rhodospirillales bacterium]